MFTINDKNWDIVCLDEHSPELQRSDGSYTLGCTDKNTNTIYIVDNIFGARLKKVLIHEVCHAFIMSYDIYIDIYSEEYLCDFLATYARDILKISKDVYKKIMESG